MAKKKEFDFDTAYNDILKEAEKVGMSNDVAFRTVIEEFKRMKIVCDRLYNALEGCDLVYEEESFKGRIITKSNPVTKEYVTAHKTLVLTCKVLKEMLANLPASDEPDF